MLPHLSKPAALLAAVLSLSLFFVGCDSVTPGPDVPSAGNQQRLLEATNDLESRMTPLGKTVKMNRFGSVESPRLAKTASGLSLTSVARIDPPDDSTRASHLTYAEGTVYAGYKARGASFRGGVDIVDASDPTNILSVSSLASDDFNIQEMAYDGDENALYLAGALRPSSVWGDLRDTPASLVKVTNFSNPQTAVVGLTGSIAQSVLTAPDGEGEHSVYVATDEQSLYRFDTALEEEVHQEVPTVGLRSVAATSSTLFAVDRRGTVYSGEVGSSRSLTEAKSIGSGVGERAIGRMEARSASVLMGDRLFLALGDEGIAVLDANSGDVLFRKQEPYYTSLTLHNDDPDITNEPTDLVYAARPNGLLDVYHVSDGGIGTGDSSTGLDGIGTFDLSALEGVEFGTSSRVSQVMGVGCHVYVASGDEGIVALKIGGVQGCDAAGGLQLPTASDDSTETTEKHSTTMDVLANDSDPDGRLVPATVKVQSPPSHGTVNVDQSTGEITYTPEVGFTGEDTYTYTVEDNDGGTSNEAMVTITVEGVMPPPPPSNAGSGAGP